jgi:hypothetical protein
MSMSTATLTRPAASLPVWNHPDVPAYAHPNGIHLVMWCRHCKRWHYHGAAAYGHRDPHCHVRSAEYAHGYVLVPAGPVPPALLANMKRDRPKGPA